MHLPGPPGSLGKTDLLLFYGAQTTDYVNAVCGTRFLPNQVDTSTELGRMVHSMWSQLLGGNWMEGEIFLLRLSLLCRQLGKIKDANPGLGQHLCHRLVRAKPKEIFWGARFEITAAASLVSKGIRISGYETPDFTLEIGEETVGVEATGVHPDGV